MCPLPRPLPPSPTHSMRPLEVIVHYHVTFHISSSVLHNIFFHAQMYLIENDQCCLFMSLC